MNQVKKLRVQKGLKQKDIAFQTGLSKASISLYESGKSKPSINSAFKIAEVLGVTVDELFIFDEKKQKEVIR